MKVIILFLLPVYIFAATKIDPTKTIGVMQSLIDFLTGGLFQIIVTLVIIIAGYMYLANKGQVAKETLLNVIIGATLVLTASAIGAAFV